MKSDYTEVVKDVSEEILAKLSHDEDGSIIESFKVDDLDPWQTLLYFGVLEDVLLEFRKGHNYKTVFIYAEAEGLAGEQAVTPVRTLMDHIAYKRVNEVMAEKLTFGEFGYDLETGEIVYSGADIKNRHCVILCDIAKPNSEYLQTCISMCKELKAARVIALPMIVCEDKVEQAMLRKGAAEKAN